MQTHPTPLNATSNSLLSQVERESLANVAEVAETKANEKALSFSTSKALGTANPGDKKLDTRGVSNPLGNTELPERVQQQLNSSKPIRSFKDLKILFHDLNTKRTAMIRAATKKNRPAYKLEELETLQKTAEGFIRSFAGKFNVMV